jgi:hypothetical protein
MIVFAGSPGVQKMKTIGLVGTAPHMREIFTHMASSDVGKRVGIQ